MQRSSRGRNTSIRKDRARYYCTAKLGQNDRNLNFSLRKLVQAIAMTGCDLSACTKPWTAQFATVTVIFQEFYAEVISLSVDDDCFHLLYFVYDTAPYTFVVN